VSAGKHVQNILDSPEDPSSLSTKVSDSKYYDIIGFDSRGVNNTTPRLRCFPDAFNQQAWALSSPDMSLLLDSESLLGLHWARAKALGESCSQEDNEDDMARFVNTAQVVEDMVEIIEKHAEWRQEEARSILQLPKEKGLSRYPEHAENIMRRTNWKKGAEKLQYWGFSYGTILGATFSAMHPDRVGRVVIDGVVDPSDYYDAHWLKNLRDTDKIMVRFSEYCFQAGPEKCPLYLGTSATDIEAHIEKIVTDLKENPIPVPASNTRGPEIVSYGDVISIITTALYETYREAEDLFHLLSELSRGNAVPFAEMKQNGLVAAEVPRACKRDGPFSDACVSADYIAMLGATRGIACMDARDITNMTKDEFREHAKEVQSQSKWMGTNWAALPLGCVGYTVRPAWSFEGTIEGNTSHPILLIGNTHDPVTPLRK
jgi:pimeloyl-ACP methyl ester carboxylesterase